MAGVSHHIGTNALPRALAITDQK